MTEERKSESKDGPKEAKRTEREGTDPESQPGEFANDMEVNRFEPPPPPKSRKPFRD